MRKAGAIAAQQAKTDRSNDGFTLIEVVVTLSILAMLMTGMAMTMARRDNTPTPVQKAKEIQAMLYLARTDAISKSSAAKVTVDIADRRFEYPSRRPISLEAGQKLKIVTGRSLINGDVVDLLFLADGGSSGADIEITDGRGRSAMLRVNWLTGLPSLEERSSK